MRWDVDTGSSGSVSVGEVTFTGCSLVTASVLARPVTRCVVLAGVFGPARVVSNDAPRARQDAHAAGGRISDTQVQ